MNSNVYYTPRTIGNLNRILTALSLKTVAPEQLNTVLQTESRSRVIRALNRANTDQGAFEYLRRLFGFESRQVDGSRSEVSANPSLPSHSDLHTCGDSAIDTKGNKQRVKKHVYGAGAALCLEEDITRGGSHTVSIDAADLISSKQYNWKEKIRLQLTSDELIVVSAVLFGMIPRCEYKNHGKDNNKGFFMEDQDDKLFVKVFARGEKLKAVPVTPEDAFFVAQICMRQMQKNAPWLQPAEIMAMLQRVVAARKVPRVLN